MPQRKFQRRREDFICLHCGAPVAGNGYTNHCPVCLWSRHVDINPGDRTASCQGLMEPISLEIKSAKYVITHRCLRCGLEKRNKISPDDNSEAFLALL